MNIKSIRLKNFLSYKDETLNINSDGIYLIVGKNGIGKSTLIKDSITYSLFGISRDNNDLDSLIYYNEDEMSITLAFELEGIDYIIERSRTRGKTTQLKLIRNDIDISEKTVKDTQQKIEGLLGMDYEVFTASVCFEQGESNKFSRLTPKQSKQFILNLLQLTKYNTYKKKVKELKDAVEEEIWKLHTIIENSKIELPKLQLIGLEKLTQYYKRIQQQISKLEIEKNIITKNRNSIYNKASSLEGSTDKFKIDLKNEYKQQDEILKIKGQCPLCFTILTEDKVKELQNKISENIKNIKTKIAMYLEQINILEKDAKGLNFNDDKLSEIRNKLLKVRDQIGKEKAYEQQKKDIQNIRDKQLEANTRLPQVLKQKEQLDKLESAFDENGIPTYIIENTLPEIENVVNEIISQLTEGRIQINFETQKELKSGDKTDTLQIMINDEIGTRPYQLYSGGEKFLIDFALRIAISIILTRRSGHKIQTLIVDEGFGSLDTENSEKLVELINYIHDHFGFRRVFIISHKDEIKESFNRIVSIYKDLDGSHI